MNTKELDSVLTLPPFKRYQYAIKRIAGNEIIYTLANQHGEYAIAEVDEHKTVPFWPNNEFAVLLQTKDWESYYVKQISLEDFKSEIVPLIKANNYLLDIFPANEKTGFVVTIEEFTRDLETELERYS